MTNVQLKLLKQDHVELILRDILIIQLPTNVKNLFMEDVWEVQTIFKINLIVKELAYIDL